MKTKGMLKPAFRFTKKHHEIHLGKGLSEVIASTHAISGRMQRRRHERG